MTPASSSIRALSFVGFAVFLIAHESKAFAQVRVSPVMVSRVVKKQVSTEQVFVGTVMPLKKSSVGAAVDGRVAKFPVNEGDRVTKDQTLAELFTETISLQIVAARAELKLRKKELRELLNGFRQEEIEQAAARMEAARARRDFAAQRLKRSTALFETAKIGTREQLEDDHSAAVASEQTYHAERLAYELMKQGPRPEKKDQGRARVAEQTALVQQLEDQRRKHTMTSPFDGYVVAEKTEVGEWVTRGDVVAEVIYLDEIDIEAHVLDAQIEHVRVGTTVPVTVPALRSSTFLGEVAIVSPQADTRSRTFPVKIRVKNIIRDDGPVLRAGMLARVKLPTSELHESLLVPKDAIVLGGGSPLVAVAVPLTDKEQADWDPKVQGMKPTSRIKFVPVELGIADGQMIAVSGDLEVNQQVVTIGNERVQPGQYVNIVDEKRVSAGDSVNVGGK